MRQPKRHAVAEQAVTINITDAESGLDPKEPYGKFSSRAQAVIDLYGPTDLVTRGKDQVMLPATLADKPDLYKLASPVTHVGKNTPPTLLTHGGRDRLVYWKNMHRLGEKLTAANVPHEIYLIPYGQHGFDYNINGWGSQVVRSASLRFLSVHTRA